MKFRGAVVTVATLLGILVLALAVGISTLSPGGPGESAAGQHTGTPSAASQPHPRGTARVGAVRPSQGHSEPRKNSHSHQERNRDSNKVRTYTVRPGDTLWSISHSTPGHPLKWLKLWHKNLEQVPNPRVIYTGEVLTL